MLRAAAHGAHAIEALLEEFPIVIDEQTMTNALLREVVEMLSPSTAAVYVRDGDMFAISASFGLSRAERTMRAKPDHPLFAELTIHQEALLIAPIDLAQGLVAGIAGTHTNALLAAPICTEGEVIAFLVLGRTDYSEADLDVCDQIAREAGPGLAVARLLSTLATRRARDAS
jgi:transcriptional regulator with GAF, ATPase, and Fis domain